MAGKSTSPETITNLTDGREAFGSSEGTCKAAVENRRENGCSSNNQKWNCLMTEQFRYISEETQNTNLKVYMHPYVH